MDLALWFCHCKLVVCSGRSPSASNKGASPSTGSARPNGNSNAAPALRKQMARMDSVFTCNTLSASTAHDQERSGQRTPRRWGLGNPAEETFRYPNQSASNIPKESNTSSKANVECRICYNVRCHSRFPLRTCQWSQNGLRCGAAPGQRSRRCRMALTITSRELRHG